MYVGRKEGKTDPGDKLRRIGTGVLAEQLMS